MKKESMLFVTKLHFNPNGNGGLQRTYFLLKELSKYYNLFILSAYSNKNDLDIDAEFIPNTSFNAKKASRKSKLNGLLFKVFNIIHGNQKSRKSIHQSNYESYLLKKQLIELKRKEKYKDIDIIVFDTLAATADIGSYIYGRRVLNAHNFDSELAKMKLENSEALKLNENQILKTKESLSILERFEHHIDSYFDEIWVCSKEDEIKFRSVNPNTCTDFFVLPNGSDTVARTFQPINEVYNKFLFVGSLDYFPNVNGLKWFVETIFKNLPKNFELNIVGRSANAKDFKYLDAYENINLIGEVENVEEYYSTHDVFVVPLLEGSGTRLKILEALSYGKLVLSTPKGIEGIEAQDGIHYMTFNNLEDFKSDLLPKLDDHNALKTVRENGRQFIDDNYSWCEIVKDYVNEKNGE